MLFSACLKTTHTSLLPEIAPLRARSKESITIPVATRFARPLLMVDHAGTAREESTATRATTTSSSVIEKPAVV
jgi:hypothetical protein